jgi:hypothetical protein
VHKDVFWLQFWLELGQFILLIEVQSVPHFTSHRVPFRSWSSRLTDSTSDTGCLFDFLRFLLVRHDGQIATSCRPGPNGPIIKAGRQLWTAFSVGPLYPDAPLQPIAYDISTLVEIVCSQKRKAESEKLEFIKLKPIPANPRKFKFQANFFPIQ